MTSLLAALSLAAPVVGRPTVARTAGASSRRPCVVRAATGPGEPQSGGRRSLVLSLISVAATVAVAKELVQDLGRGIDTEGNTPALLPVPAAGQAVATFAGGCFWCMEAPFDILPGVLATTSGYSGGRTERPTYLQVSAGGSGHAESVQVLYDPQRVSYEQLLDAFWHSIDPTQADGQFVDRGDQYRSVIFTHTPEQQAAAVASLERLSASGVFGAQKIATQIKPAATFWPAEQYHQDYYSKKNRYQVYRFASGRDQFLASVWGAKFVADEQAAARVKAAELAAARNS